MISIFKTTLFLATCLFLQNTFSNVIIEEDFNDQDLYEDPSWNGNINNFEVLNASYFPLTTTSTDESFLATKVSSSKSVLLVESHIVDRWTFSLGTGDFSPSSVNYFGVVLMSDVVLSGSIVEERWHGYYLRIGDGSLDQICLYIYMFIDMYEW